MINVFCIPEFESEFQKLRKNNSYGSLEADIRDYFFVENIQDVQSGSRLNGANEPAYIKKRLEGRGGFRVYFLLTIFGNTVHLMFVHPKTGKDGFDNITREYQAELYKRVLECRNSNDLFKITVDNGKLVFKHLSVLGENEIFEKVQVIEAKKEEGINPDENSNSATP